MAEPRVSSELATERLRLRLTRPEDGPALLAYYSDPHVVRYTPHTPWTQRSVSEHVTGRMQQDGLTSESGALALVIEEAGTVVGDVVLWSTSSPRGVAELGFALDPRFQGRGLATEAVKAVLSHAFETNRLHRVEARVDPRNLPSIRLCVRAGLRLEGLLRQDYWCKGEWTDTAVYACLNSDC